MLIYNCLIYNNTSAQFGVVRLDGWSLSGQTAKKTKSASVINCTIVNNKTLTTTSAQLELVFYGGSAVNCIVLNAPAGTGPFDIRFQSPLCLFSNSVYGAHTGTVSFSATADNVVAGKSIKDLKFVRPLYQLGAAGSADNNPFFDKELFDSIRTANFKIASAESPAVTTPGALVLPATIPASANETLPIPVVGSIPTTDMLGVSRATTNTIGAYQFSGASALRNNYENKTLQVITLPNSILINNQQGKEVVLYSMSGQMLHKQLLKSNNEIIHLNTGFYVVAVDKLVNRVIIK
jgi:hypothetical protein